MFSISQPCSRCGGAGTVIEDPARPATARARCAPSSACASTSPPACGTAAASASPARASPAQRRPARRPVPDHPRQRLAGVQAQGRQPRGRGAADDPRGAARRRGRGADAQRHEDAARPARAPSTARSSGCAARARRSSERLRASGRHPLPLRDRGAGRPQDEQQKAVDALSQDLRRATRAASCSTTARAPPARAATRGGASDERPERRRSAERRAPAALDPTVTRVEVETDRGVFMISVAAELANMHPQTLRMYEARGLIEPQRSPKGTRLYSQEDVERLRRIQEMTAELGLNLAGVERVLDLEQRDRGRCTRASRRSNCRRCRRRCSWPRSSSRCAARSAPSSCRTAESSSWCAPPTCARLPAGRRSTPGGDAA